MSFVYFLFNLLLSLIVYDFIFIHRDSANNSPASPLAATPFPAKNAQPATKQSPAQAAASKYSGVFSLPSHLKVVKYIQMPPSPR